MKIEHPNSKLNEDALEKYHRKITTTIVYHFLVKNTSYLLTWTFYLLYNENLLALIFQLSLPSKSYNQAKLSQLLP